MAVMLELTYSQLFAEALQHIKFYDHHAAVHGC
jgi:hypothetical protein